MAGKGFESGSRDQLDELQAQIEDLQYAVKNLQNIKQPTVPIYQNFAAPNPGDLPDDPVEGQIAIGDDNIHRWFSNGAWHSASAGADARHLFVRANQNLTAGVRTQLDLSSPFWSTDDVGGVPSTGGIPGFDGDNFKIDTSGDPNNITIKNAGVYYVQVAPLVNTTSIGAGDYTILMGASGLGFTFGSDRLRTNKGPDDLKHFTYMTHILSGVSATWFITQNSSFNWTAGGGSQSSIDVYIIKVR